jgi:hypothetical protein
LVVSRPAQRSLAITTCRLAASPKATHLSRRLRPFCFLHHRSDSFRWSDPVAGQDFHLLKIRQLHGSRRTPCFRPPREAAKADPDKPHVARTLRSVDSKLLPRPEKWVSEILARVVVYLAARCFQVAQSRSRNLAFISAVTLVEPGCAVRINPAPAELTHSLI